MGNGPRKLRGNIGKKYRMKGKDIEKALRRTAGKVTWAMGLGKLCMKVTGPACAKTIVERSAGDAQEFLRSPTMTTIHPPNMFKLNKIIEGQERSTKPVICYSQSPSNVPPWF